MEENPRKEDDFAASFRLRSALQDAIMDERYHQDISETIAGFFQMHEICLSHIEQLLCASSPVLLRVRYRQSSLLCLLELLVVCLVNHMSCSTITNLLGVKTTEKQLSKILLLTLPLSINLSYESHCKSKSC